MKKITYMILSFLKYILILWIPILLIEETFLYDYFTPSGTLIISLLMSLICLISYIKDYKKISKEKNNCYIYNIINTILLVVTNLGLGYLFLELIDLNIFHQCIGDGWACFLFGIEYLMIGFIYASLSVLVLIIWLLIRLIKYLKLRKKNR